MIHVTLQTGHVRDSDRSEVDPDILRRLRGALRRALDARGAPMHLPGPPGHTLTAAAEGGDLIVTIWRGSKEAPLATVGVACDDGAGLWALLHERSSTGPLATAGQPVPRAPWCASRLDIGIALEPSAAEWLGDAARCLAWAWIDYREGVS